MKFFCIFDTSDPSARRMKTHLFTTLREAADEAEILLTKHPENTYRVMKIVDVESGDWE